MSKNQTTIIGGLFGLECEYPPSTGHPAFLSVDSLCLVNARSCFFALLSALTPETVWLPAYLCDSLLLPAVKSGVERKFYPVSRGLKVEDQSWIAKVRERDIVVLIDYFGFPSDAECAEKAKRRGAFILEDACQALLSNHSSVAADFRLYSPRKFFGVPDGGILVPCGDSLVPEIEIEPPPKEFLSKAIRAVTLRRGFDRGKQDRNWFSLGQEVERTQPLGLFGMSHFTQNLLQRGIDFNKASAARRANYSRLLNCLSEYALFPELPRSVTPLGFPVILEDRDALRQMLFSHSIYPPVHWPIPSSIKGMFPVSDQLANEILTLPCDQRYGTRHMDKIARLLLEKKGRRGV